MSLVASYVHCKDNKFYDGLVYWDLDHNWFICFDDDEPVELVAKTSANIDPKKVLDELGIPYTSFRKHSAGGKRSFSHWTKDHPPNTQNFFPAQAWFIETKAVPFPSPRPWDTYDNMHDKNPKRQGVYFGGL